MRKKRPWFASFLKLIYPPRLLLKRFIDKWLRPSSARVFWRNWHGLLGALIALPLLFLTVSGVLLSHSDQLGLSEKEVHTRWILEKYGFEQGEVEAAFTLVGGGYVAQSEEAVIYRGQVVASALTRLTGGAKIENGHCLVTEDEVHYFAKEQAGELTETLGSTVLPRGEISQVGVDAKKLLVIRLQTEEGGEQLLRFDQDMYEAAVVDPIELGDVQWSESKSLSATEKEQVYGALSGEGIPLDRVILDLHSGNLFGAVGKWLLTLFSGVIVLVCVSGLYLFLKGRVRRRKECFKECASVCQDLE